MPTSRWPRSNLSENAGPYHRLRRRRLGDAHRRGAQLRRRLRRDADLGRRARRGRHRARHRRRLRGPRRRDQPRNRAAGASSQSERARGGPPRQHRLARRGRGGQRPRSDPRRRRPCGIVRRRSLPVAHHPRDHDRRRGGRRLRHRGAAGCDAARTVRRSRAGRGDQRRVVAVARRGGCLPRTGPDGAGRGLDRDVGHRRRARRPGHQSRAAHGPSAVSGARGWSGCSTGCA